MAIDEEISDLYAVPLEEFTERRNALAASLKEAGRAEDAARVRGLRKATAPAALVNRLSRSEPKRIAALAAAVRAVQAAATPDELKRAMTKRRTIIDDLTERAESLEGATAPNLAALAQTLASATSDEDLEALRLGALAKPIVGSGFGGSLAVEPPAKPAEPSADDEAAKERRQKLDGEIESRRDDLAAARRRVRDAKAALDEAEREVRDIEHAIETLERKRDDAG